MPKVRVMVWSSWWSHYIKTDTCPNRSIHVLTHIILFYSSWSVLFSIYEIIENSPRCCNYYLGAINTTLQNCLVFITTRCRVLDGCHGNRYECCYWTNHCIIDESAPPTVITRDPLLLNAKLCTWLCWQYVWLYAYLGGDRVKEYRCLVNIYSLSAIS